MLGLSSETTSGTTRYVRDPRGKLIGSRRPSGTSTLRHYYLHDQLGSVVAMANTSGGVALRHVYDDPYGSEVTTSGSLSNPWRFAAEYLDAETGLYKIGARYYAPTQARWTQKDPLNQAFSPREANGYVYTAGDPINLTDPTGTHLPPRWWRRRTRAM